MSWMLIVLFTAGYVPPFDFTVADLSWLPISLLSCRRWNTFCELEVRCEKIKVNPKDMRKAILIILKMRRPKNKIQISITYAVFSIT